MNAPRVSVVMAVYNGAEFLRPAIDSILRQTFTDFEFVIVDDGSTDAVPQILGEYAARDPRIVVLRNPANLRLVASLNRGLEQARASLIARMDADDIAHPERLAAQVAFLDAHPDHLLVGSGYRHMAPDGRITGARPNPMDWRCTDWVTRFRTPMIHPSFCFRRSLPSGEVLRYDPDYPRAEDYALIALMAQHGRIAVLPEQLIDCRMHAANIRSSQTAAMQGDARRICEAELSRHYGADLCGRLASALDPLYLLREARPGDVRTAAQAFEQIIAQDARDPGEARWMRRRAAGFLAEGTIGRAKGSARWRIALAFVRHATRFIVPMLARMAENRGLIAPANAYPASFRHSQPSA